MEQIENLFRYHVQSQHYSNSFWGYPTSKPFHVLLCLKAAPRPVPTTVPRYTRFYPALPRSTSISTPALGSCEAEKASVSPPSPATAAAQQGHSSSAPQGGQERQQPQEQAEPGLTAHTKRTAQHWALPPGPWKVLAVDRSRTEPFPWNSCSHSSVNHWLLIYIYINSLTAVWYFI